MGLLSDSSLESSPAVAEAEAEAAAAESVIVVMNANRSKVSVDALDWAIRHIVRPRDTVIVLGVLSVVGDKKSAAAAASSSSSSPSSSSCLPFNMRISLSGISVRVEFSGQGDQMSPRKLEDKVEKKREDYQCTFHPFYRQCKKNEVKLEVKLAVGYDRNIAIEEAQNCNPRWVVLDSHLKEDTSYIHRHVACNVAVMKDKGVATLKLSRAPEHGKWPMEFGNSKSNDCEMLHNEDLNAVLNKTVIPAPTQSPCWYPLSWRTGFPRAFYISELEAITNDFSSENLVKEEGGKRTYRGIFQETPVLIKRFCANDERFWSALKILSRVRHRNILNLVGYCCYDEHGFLLCDYPCSGTVEMNLLRDESAKSLSWRIRWYIAQEIAISVRYLHEECVDGPIVDLSVCSSSVVFSHGSSAMLSIFNTARWLKDDIPCNEDSPAEYPNTEDKRLLKDVRDYGMFLIELITGKSARCFEEQGECQTLIDWALPFLENGSLNQLMDPRLMDTSDAEMVNHMARAALLCLKDDTDQKYSISEVFAVVRGDQRAATTSW